MGWLTSDFLLEFEALFPGIFQQNVSLSDLSRWKVGGTVALFVEPKNSVQLQGVLEYFSFRQIKYIIIGDTSNILFDSDGLDIVCVRIGRFLSAIYREENFIYAEAGIWVPKLALFAMHAGLSGIEHISGIPGTLGGLICMNGGSLRQSISSSIEFVVSFDSKGKQIKRHFSSLNF